jgi:regulator of RNase E activity RraA
MNNDPIAKVFRELENLDSCSVANAVDSMGARLLNEGIIGSEVPRRTEVAGSMLGMAMTIRVRSAEPPMKPGFYLEHADWWEHLGEAAFPRVLVIEDCDATPGKGSLVGPVHACILKALGFTGVVTSGSVRGIAKFSEIGLHAFAAKVSPSHAYCHVVEMGGPVRILGVPIETGQILHGDGNGIVVIPPGLAERVPAEAARSRERERTVCTYCSDAAFSTRRLREVIRAAGPER